MDPGAGLRNRRMQVQALPSTPPRRSSEGREHRPPKAEIARSSRAGETPALVAQPRRALLANSPARGDPPRAGLAPSCSGRELPIWVPPDGDMAGLHAADVTTAFAHGLRCRSVAQTVADTWTWLQTAGDPKSLSDGSVGLDPTREMEVIGSVY
jgi:hypothetical protein